MQIAAIALAENKKLINTLNNILFNILIKNKPHHLKTKRPDSIYLLFLEAVNKIKVITFLM
ncbi:hypothetical protein P20429_1480 [Pseudoalteromonas sp. BSi20429]|nr:hypothetical protein P20429_1480 [Pseudoalteromonas sp. BSi20429]